MATREDKKPTDFLQQKYNELQNEKKEIEGLLEKLRPFIQPYQQIEPTARSEPDLGTEPQKASAKPDAARALKAPSEPSARREPSRVSEPSRTREPSKVSATKDALKEDLSAEPAPRPGRVVHRFLSRDELVHWILSKDGDIELSVDLAAKELDVEAARVRKYWYELRREGYLAVEVENNRTKYYRNRKKVK